LQRIDLDVEELVKESRGGRIEELGGIRNEDRAVGCRLFRFSSAWQKTSFEDLEEVRSDSGEVDGKE